ncbi:MAG: SEC-C domain-containing protein [Bryobacterales bacterium]|nr:SEC-C domain-containing protein [Bryobacterales bacterium]
MLQTDRGIQQISNGTPPDEFAPLADVPKIDSFARRIAKAPATIDDNIRHALSTQNAILTLESQIREKGVVPVSGHRYVKTAQAATKPANPTKSTTCETKSAPQPEVGRNSPCPCGSGQKYKRCCGVNAPPIYNHAA